MTEAPEFQDILYEVRDRAAWITINRPKVYNAFRGQTVEGVQSYSDPVNGGLVQLPMGWDEYWVNEQGEYLASDVPGFDPNTMNDGVWQQLEVADI